MKRPKPFDNRYNELMNEFRKSVKGSKNFNSISTNIIGKLETNRQKSNEILNEIIKNYYAGNNEAKVRIKMYEDLKKFPKNINVNNRNYKTLNEIKSKLNNEKYLNRSTLEKILKALLEMKYTKDRYSQISRVRRRLDRINNRNMANHGDNFINIRDKKEYENIIETYKKQRHKPVNTNILKNLENRLKKIKNRIPNSKKREYAIKVRCIRKKIHRKNNI